MKKFNFMSVCLLFLSGSLVMAVPLGGIRTSPNTESHQDLLQGPWTHELGTNFPDDEKISVVSGLTTYIPCPVDYQGVFPNYEITMTNLTNTAWKNVTYVTDPETTITNADCTLINGEQAFRIDNGMLDKNKPLVYESMAPDCVFQPGETWKFVIQEYSNTLGLAVGLFRSYDTVKIIGLVGDQSGGDTNSSGSIIAAPEPATITLLALGGLALLRRKRSKA